ncbi:MAG: hypothetical protein ACRCXE_01105 [Metamycoplasmataceae bacterium]
MKKILLGTGALALSVIPVAVTVSCSSEETTLQKEADKFKKSVKTDATGMKSSDAAGSIIYDTPTPADKKAALVKLAKVPTLDSKYEFAVISADVDTTTKTTINVEIEVWEGSNTTDKIKVTFKVTDFGMPATLADEVTKFTTAVATKNASMTTENAVLTINDASGAVPKWQALHALATTVRGAGFTYEVKSAKVDEALDTTMLVEITITELVNNTSETVWLPVTGFTAA